MGVQTALPLATLPADARCARHPEAKATSTCYRCGAFVCAQDFALLDGHVFCPDCAARPEVDYLEAYRLKYWGKRDGWAWAMGLGGLLNVLAAVLLLVAALSSEHAPGSALLALATLAIGANGLLFWAGFPLARVGLFVGLGLLGLLNMMTMGPAGAGSIAVPLIVAASAVMGTRNKLFFKQAVARTELKRAWDLFHNNTIARSATTLGVAGLLIPVFSPLAVICGVIGLKRVNPDAHPPIGNKGRAIGGIVLGALGPLLWGGVFLLIRLAQD